MEKTEMKIGTNYMDFVYKLHDTLCRQNIVLVYEGEVNQTITKAFTAMTEKNLSNEAESEKVTKRVYHVMVECLQNICKHSDDMVTGEPYFPGSGICVVSRDGDKYVVTTGNTISLEHVEGTKAMLDKFNALDKDEIKATYKTMLKASRLSEKAGAGLGLIDIIKKTGNKIDYHFEKVNDKTSFFIQRSTINRL